MKGVIGTAETHGAILVVHLSGLLVDLMEATQRGARLEIQIGQIATVVGMAMALMRGFCLTTATQPSGLQVLSKRCLGASQPTMEEAISTDCALSQRTRWT